MPVNRTGSRRHTHKYQWVNGVWSCALPDCTHYMPKNVAHMITGKMSVCWGCGAEMILTTTALTDTRPQCEDCKAKTSGIDEYLAAKGL